MTNQIDRFKSSSAALWASALSLTETNDKLSRGLRLGATVIGPALLGWAGWLGFNHPWSAAIVSVAVVLVAIGIVVILVADRPRLIAWNAAKDLRDQVEEFILERDQLSNEARLRAHAAERRDARLIALRTMIESVEEVLVQPRSTLGMALSLMMDNVHLTMQKALAFGNGDDWTLAIFLPQKIDGEEVMTRLVGHSSKRGWENNTGGRTWARGKGFAGTAWSDERDVVHRDADSDIVLQHYPSDHPKPDDKDRFKSVACIPARTRSTPKVRAVVCATINRNDHFWDDGPENAKLSADIVRDIATVVAMAAIAFDGKDSAVAGNGLGKRGRRPKQVDAVTGDLQRNGGNGS